MKQSILFLFLIFFYQAGWLSGQNQSPQKEGGCDPKFEWVRSAESGQRSLGKWITHSPDGVIYVAGSFWGSINLGGNLLTGPGGEDLFFAAYSPEGRLLWAKSAGGIGNDSIFSFKYDPLSKSISIGGAFISDCVFDHIYLRERPSEKNPAVMQNFFSAVMSLDGKFVQAGLVEEKVRLENNTFRIEPIGAITTVQNEKVASSSQSIEPEYFLTSNSISDKSFRTLISGGNVEKFGLDNYGNAWVIGNFIREEVRISHRTVNISQDQNVKSNYWIAYFDNRGSIRWMKTFQSSGKITFEQILPLKDQTALLVGSFTEDIVCGTTKIHAYGNEDAFIFQINTESELIRAKSLGGNQPDAIYGVSQSDNEDLYFTGKATAPAHIDDIEILSNVKSSKNIEDTEPSFFITKVSCGVSDSCVVASRVAISLATENTLLVEWINTLPSKISGNSAFEVQYRILSNDKSQKWFSKKTTKTTALIEGLTKGESYEIRVRRICSEGVSAFSPIIQGKTLLPILTCDAPEDFSIRAINPTKATVQWFEKPDGSVISKYEVIYRKRGHSGWSSSVPSDNPNASRLTDLAPLTEYETRLIVKCSGFSSDTSKIKRFTTIKTEGCVAPSEVRATHILHQSAHIIWSGNSKAGSYRVQWRKLGTDYWNSENTGLTGMVLFGLQSDAAYEVKIRSKCGHNIYSQYSETVRFRTLKPCQPSSEILVPDVTFTSAWITWDTVPGAHRYEVNYRTRGTIAWNKVITKNRFSQLSGLQPETRYEVRLRVFCVDSVESEFTRIQEFMTKAVTACKTVENVIVSPATDHCVVRWKPSKTATGYKIFWKLNRGSLTWNVAIIKDPTTNNFTIPNLSSSAPYLLRIATFCETVTQAVERSFHTQAPKMSFAGVTNESLEIFPNPVKDRARIEFNYISNDKNANIEVFDLMGRKMFTQTLPQNKGVIEINTITWESGVYFCKLFIDDETFAIKKILVTK